VKSTRNTRKQVQSSPCLHQPRNGESKNIPNRPFMIFPLWEGWIPQACRQGTVLHFPHPLIVVIIVATHWTLAVEELFSYADMVTIRTVIAKWVESVNIV
jgi:hypothetical protein